jgi:amino acid transporter
MAFISNYTTDGSPDDSPALWITIFLVVIGVVNMLPVGIYGELEYVFGCAKMLFICGLIVFNVILSASQLETTFSKGDHFWTWNSPYSFASKGILVNGNMVIGSGGQFAAFWTAVTKICWSLVGFETIGVTAAENRDLERWETMRLASKKLLMRISILYTLSTFAASLNVPMDDPMLVDIGSNTILAGQNSIFVLAAVRNHLTGWASFFNGFYIFSATTSAVNALYISSRLLHALASIPEVWPLWAQTWRKRLERTSYHGIPLATVSVSWLFGLLAYLATKHFPGVVLGRITTNATVSCKSPFQLHANLEQYHNTDSLQ